MCLLRSDNTLKHIHHQYNANDDFLTYFIANTTFLPDPLVYHGDMRLQAGPEQTSLNFSYFYRHFLPRGENFTAVRTRVTVVLNTLMNDLDVPVQVPLLAKDLVALGTGGWLVDLDVEVDLLDVPVESALLAEDISAVRTHDAVDVVEPPHVGCEVRDLQPALGAGQVLQLGHVDLQSVDVESGLGGELLVTVRALPHVGGEAEHWPGGHLLRGFAGTRLDCREGLAEVG